MYVALIIFCMFCTTDSACKNAMKSDMKRRCKASCELKHLVTIECKITTRVGRERERETLPSNATTNTIFIIHEHTHIQ